MIWPKSVESFLQSSDNSPSTMEKYRRALDEFAAWYRQKYGEDPEATLLNNVELRDWKVHLSKQRRLAASTVNGRLAAVRSLARFHGRWLDVKDVKIVRAPAEHLNGRELGRLKAIVEGPRWMDRRNTAIVALMASAGLRVSEVVGLNVDDLTIRPRSGWARIRHGRGMKERKVPLNPTVRRALREYLKARPAQAVELEDDLGKPLFLSRRGLRLDRRDVGRMIAVAAQQARLEKKVTPHTLRHTFATRFLQQGGDLATLRDILGHKNITTTNRYVHSSAERMLESVENL